jgi:hypothetical protein
MYKIKSFGLAAVAAATMMAMAWAGSASAANWDPANTTLTAHGTLGLDLSPSGVSLTCTFHSGVRSTGNDLAVTTNAAGDPAGPTFSACTTSLPSVAVGIAATPGTAGAWNLTATSTTAVDVTNENFTITVTSGGVAVCTVSLMNVSVAGNTWSNATSTLTPTATSFPIVETGVLCPGDTTARFTGSIAIPGASIT